MTSTFQVMPDLTADEYAALRADIEAHGVRYPVVVDQHGRVLDGHNRMAIAAELNIECPKITEVVADDDAARDRALVLNVARRHLTSAQKRDLIRAELDVHPDRSDRAIARVIGCDHKTVASVRRGGEIPQRMSREEAEERTEALGRALVEMQDQLLVLVTVALTNNVDRIEIVRALNGAMRSLERQHELHDGWETVSRMIYQPILDLVLDPDMAEQWTVKWDSKWQPMTKDEVRHLLDGIAKSGGAG